MQNTATLFGILLIAASSALAQPQAMAQPKTEDLQVLQTLLQPTISAVDKWTDRAATLPFQKYDKGMAISFDRCKAIEVEVSKNYSLPTYYENGQVQHGIQICPATEGVVELFDGDWIVPHSVKFSLEPGSTKNLLGVEGAFVLTVEYAIADPALDEFKQYILDKNFKMIQYSAAKFDGSFRDYTVISALNDRGDVLSNTYPTRRGSTHPYQLRQYARYISVDGKVSPASKIIRNDSLANEVVERSYVVAYKWQWDAFELSPYTREGGLYKIGNRVTDWLSSQYRLRLFSKPGLSCGFGFIGWDADGNELRTFGDKTCPAQMKIRDNSL